MKKYYLANKEKCLQYGKQWYQDNRELVLQQCKEYRQIHKEKIKNQREGYARHRYHHLRTGKVFIKNGYWVYSGLKAVHVVLAEYVLGRRLQKGECVHHIDGDGKNNHHSNLLICTISYHQWLHKKMSRLYMNEHFLNGGGVTHFGHKGVISSWER